MPDLTTLNDEELLQMRLDVATEQERRARLVEIPTQVAQLAIQYVEDGGDLSDLTSVIPNPE